MLLALAASLGFGGFRILAKFIAPGRIFDRNADIEILRWWSELMVVPQVAIGGITVENATPLVEAGADFLAVSAGVWEHHKGPEEAVREFNALFR